MLRGSRAFLGRANQPSILGALSAGQGGARFCPSNAWYFWTPVWGSQYHAWNEEPYRSKAIQHTHWRITKPWQPEFSEHLQWYKDLRQNHSFYNAGMAWASRRRKDSAIEIEGTFVACYGEAHSINMYTNPGTNETGANQRQRGHHMRWTFLPPHKYVACPYCRVIFRRKPGWVPGFDSNLLPELGVQPNSLDPILAGVTKGEARAGDAGTVPAPAPLKGMPRKNMWHTERTS